MLPDSGLIHQRRSTSTWGSPGPPLMVVNAGPHCNGPGGSWVVLELGSRSSLKSLSWSLDQV